MARTALILLVCSFYLPASSHADEPIALEILFDGVPAEGGGWVLTVTLLARTDLDTTHLTVETSNGLKIVAGEPHWQGSLSAGGEHLLELSLTLVEPPPQKVIIRVQGRLRDGTPFERKVVRTI